MIVQLLDSQRMLRRELRAELIRLVSQTPDLRSECDVNALIDITDGVADLLDSNVSEMFFCVVDSLVAAIQSGKKETGSDDVFYSFGNRGKGPGRDHVTDAMHELRGLGKWVVGLAVDFVGFDTRGEKESANPSDVAAGEFSG